jgi:hypothetical protein
MVHTQMQLERLNQINVLLLLKDIMQDMPKVNSLALMELIKIKDLNQLVRQPLKVN